LCLLPPALDRFRTFKGFSNDLKRLAADSSVIDERSRSQTTATPPEDFDMNQNLSSRVAAAVSAACTTAVLFTAVVSLAGPPATGSAQQNLQIAAVSVQK
jgi:hypothetical protein